MPSIDTSSIICTELHPGPSESAEQNSLFRKTILKLKNRWHLHWNSPEGAWSPWVLGAFLAGAVFLAYSNSFHGPFQYDDYSDIRDNLTIRHLWPLRDVFFIPGSGFMSRPVANLTFALNFATGGLKPFHYHLTNLGIHICAALAFLGVVRRTLLLPQHRTRFAGQISTLSLVTAALWALHPLLTESVSYITQRYESLMGLFVLLTFYCVLRMAESPSPAKWALLGSLSCLLALGSKEVAVSVPFLVLLFDRTFLAGSFRGAWRRRRMLYLGLMVAWACFAFIQLRSAGDRTFAGFGLTMPWWRYALNEPSVILHYLRLTIWPYPLNFDYFWPVAKTWNQLLPGLLAIGTLLGLTLWALIRKPTVAFLPVFFFLILAPTSSVMPILDLAVEHRMYLPLVPVVVFFVLSIRHLIATISCPCYFQRSSIRLVVVVLVASSLSTLGALTYLRNEDYQDTIDLWRDAVTKAPNNPRAHHNYAFFLAEAGYTDEALRQYDIAIRQAPGTAPFHSNYGVLLSRLGRYTESLDQLRMAVQLEPTNYKNYINLGGAFFAKNSLESATTCFEEAIQINPRTALPYSALAAVALAKNQIPKAYNLVQKAIGMEPENSVFKYQLGTILIKLGDLTGARSAFQASIRLDGSPEKMASQIGWDFHMLGLDSDAVSYFHQALQLKPDHVQSQVRLGWILATSPEGKVRDGTEALTLAEGLLKTQPFRTPELLDLQAVALAEVGRFSEARTALQEALSQSKVRTEKWVPELEKRLVLFEKRQPYHELPKLPIPSETPKQP